MDLIFETLIEEFRDRTLPEFNLRSIISPPIDSGKIITIIGPRRAGKSTFFFQVFTQLIANGVTADRIFFFNFEDDRIAGLKSNQLDSILNACRNRTQADLSQCYFFFDEIQELPLWDKFVRRVYDTVSKNIWITGSNARMLSSEIPTHLRGRTLTYKLLPYSLKEFAASVKKLSPETNQIRLSSTDIFQFLKFGGFPEVSTLADSAVKLKALQEYLDVMLYRDLIERQKIAQPVLARLILQRFFDSAGCLVSVNKIHKQFESVNIAIGISTLYDYLSALENAFAIGILEQFHEKPFIRKTGNRKLYAIDTGFLSATSPRQNLGIQLEHAVWKELVLLDTIQLWSYKDGVQSECDFVYQRQNGQIYALQVSVDISHSETERREIRGLLSACKKFGLKSGTIVTLSENRKITVDGVKVSVVSLSDWVNGYA